MEGASMKYISLVLILVAMSWTWSLSRHRDALDEGVHVGIQDDMKRIITEYIQENLPTAKNLRFERMWSEQIKENQVKATFVYSFEDDTEETAARIEIEGYALLNRDPKSDEKYDVWSFDELHILNNHVIFKDGIAVTGRPNEDSEMDDK